MQTGGLEADVLRSCSIATRGKKQGEETADEHVIATGKYSSRKGKVSVKEGTKKRES